MLRIFGTFGLGILFLVISPGLRGSVMDILQSFGKAMDENSPLSYVGLGAVLLLAMMFLIYRAAQPKS